MCSFGSGSDGGRVELDAGAEGELGFCMRDVLFAGRQLRAICLVVRGKTGSTGSGVPTRLDAEMANLDPWILGLGSIGRHEMPSQIVSLLGLVLTAGAEMGWKIPLQFVRSLDVFILLEDLELQKSNLEVRDQHPGDLHSQLSA